MEKLLGNKKLLAGICGGAVAAVILIAVLVFQMAVKPNQLYQEATEQFAAGNYAEAYEALQKVPEGKNDTAELLPYYAAHAAFAQGDYTAAAKQFADLGDKWEDCADYAAYSQAQVDLADKEYGAAYTAFLGLGDFLDSADMLPECRYRMAADLLAEKDYAGALERFSALGGYKDSADQGKECSYQLALQTLDAGAYGDAYTAFAALGDYKDAEDMLLECRYRMAEGLLAEGDYAGALERYSALADYKDSADKANECRYQQAEQLFSEGWDDVERLNQAKELATALGDYKDSADLLARIEEAIEDTKRYTHPPEAFFDVTYSTSDGAQLKLYKLLYKVRMMNERSYVVPCYHNVGDWFDITTSAPSFRLQNGQRIESEWISHNSNRDGVYYTKNSQKTITVYKPLSFGKALQIDGNSDSYNTRSSMGHSFYNAKASEETVDGYVGGAIVFDDYNYIDLSSYSFSRIQSINGGVALTPVDNRDIIITAGGNQLPKGTHFGLNITSTELKSSTTYQGNKINVYFLRIDNPDGTGSRHVIAECTPWPGCPLYVRYTANEYSDDIAKIVTDTMSDLLSHFHKR